MAVRIVGIHGCRGTEGIGYKSEKGSRDLYDRVVDGGWPMGNLLNPTQVSAIAVTSSLGIGTG